MAGYVANIEELTRQNEKFREVVYTAGHSQLTLMSLEPGEDIGLEVHDDVDQFLRIEQGEGRAILAGEETKIGDGSAVVVPAGVEHNIVNDSDTEKMKLYTIYSPAHHRDGVVHTTKQEALADDEHFDGQTTEG